MQNGGASRCCLETKVLEVVEPTPSGQQSGMRAGVAPNRPSANVLALAKRLQPRQSAQNFLIPEGAIPGIFWDPGRAWMTLNLGCHVIGT